MSKTTFSPVVYAVGKDYQIVVPVYEEVLMWVRVGEEEYYDHSNGVMHSDVLVHKMTVPMEELDREKSYTICTRKVIKRKAYFTETEDVVENTFAFQPVEGEEIKAYHLSDIHNRTSLAIAAAKAYGEVDFLIMNGDIAEHSDTVENAQYIHEIVYQISEGRIPVIFSRGNHDMRGIYGDRLHENMPCDNGKPYYSFRLGSIWGLVLDCGEDKPDDHPEYGHTLCCRVMREDETRYIKNLVKRAEEEFAAEGIKNKLIIAHYPFSLHCNPPFYMENDIYREWCALLKEYVKPDLMIGGHMHYLAINHPGCEADKNGQPCTVVVGAALKEGYYAGTGLKMTADGIEVTFTDSDGKIVKQEWIGRK